MAQLFRHSCKKVRSRALYPLSGLGRRRAYRHVPRCCESAKVIEADCIHMIEQSTYSVDRPTIAAGAKPFPVVNRIAPQLSLRAEVVGGNAGNEPRPVIFVEKKQFRICPNIARIWRDKERQIAD